MQTSYNVDYYQKSMELKLITATQPIQKCTKANFILGDSSVYPEFISTNSDFQNKTDRSKIEQGNLVISPEVVIRPQQLNIGNLSEKYSVTTNREYFQGQKIPEHQKNKLKSQKLKILNLFEPKNQEPEIHSSHYQTIHQPSLFPAVVSTNPLKTLAARDPSVSNVIFGVDRVPFTSTMKDAFYQPSIHLLNGQNAHIHPSCQSFSVSQNKYRPLNVKVNRFHNDNSNFNFPASTAEEIRARSLVNQIQLGFHVPEYISETKLQFREANAKPDPQITKPVSVPRDFKQSGTGKSMWKNEPIIGKSVYAERFQSPPVEAISSHINHREINSNNYYVGNTPTNWQTTCLSKFFKQF